jgi:hypothetical protein
MKLFEPIRIGTLELKNRMVMAPMATHYANESGAVTARLKNYYAARARGGAGLIITEGDRRERSFRMNLHILLEFGQLIRMGLGDYRSIIFVKSIQDVPHLARRRGF